MPFARKTIKSFQQAIKKLGLQCPLFIAQNDGTVLLAKAAAQLPIRTFSSGPTNSMRGAAFLVEKEVKESVMVVDIGENPSRSCGIVFADILPGQEGLPLTSGCSLRVDSLVKLLLSVRYAVSE